MHPWYKNIINHLLWQFHKLVHSRYITLITRRTKCAKLVAKTVKKTVPERFGSNLSWVSPKTAERMMAPLSVPNSEQEEGSCILIGPLVLYDESKDDVVLQFDFMLSVSALPKTPPFSASLWCWRTALDVLCGFDVNFFSATTWTDVHSNMQC